MPDSQDPPAATTPALHDSASLVGEWRITGPGAECAIEVFENPDLSSTDPGVPVLGVRPLGRCAGLEDLQGLQPVPLGFALLRENGAAVGPFEQVGPDQFRSIDQMWTVSRG